jgi:hypothetical protein
VSAHSKIKLTWESFRVTWLRNSLKAASDSSNGSVDKHSWNTSGSSCRLSRRGSHWSPAFSSRLGEGWCAAGLTALCSNFFGERLRGGDTLGCCVPTFRNMTMETVRDKSQRKEKEGWCDQTKLLSKHEPRENVSATGTVR